MLRRLGKLPHIRKRSNDLLKKERRSPIKLPLQQRLPLWSHGFLSESRIIYGLDTNDYRQYVSDYYRFVVSPTINGRYSIVASDKLLFARVFGTFGDRLVRDFALIKKDALINFSSHELTTHRDIIDLCRTLGTLVVKPVKGGGGSNIYVLRAVGDQIQTNDVVMEEQEALGFLKTRDGYIVCEFVEQHPYASRIFSKSVNTIRVLTMWDIDEHRPFIAAAVHRFGRNSTAPVDNWTRGGLSCRVDLSTGTLSKGVSYPKESKLIWHEVHPDTKEPLEHVSVPMWEQVKEEVLKMARSVPFLPYLGWDIVVTAQGMKVLEGNNYSDLNLIQVHGPLLNDERVRKFYDQYAF
jgi:hypothetical protein